MEHVFIRGGLGLLGPMGGDDFGGGEAHCLNVGVESALVEEPAEEP